MTLYLSCKEGESSLSIVMPREKLVGGDRVRSEASHSATFVIQSKW